MKKRAILVVILFSFFLVNSDSVFGKGGGKAKSSKKTDKVAKIKPEKSKTKKSDVDRQQIYRSRREGKQSKTGELNKP